MLWSSLIPELEGLPFVDIYTESGQYVASTLDLPHRLGTGYLLNKYTKLDGQRLGRLTPTDSG